MQKKVNHIYWLMKSNNVEPPKIITGSGGRWSYMETPLSIAKSIIRELELYGDGLWW